MDKKQGNIEELYSSFFTIQGGEIPLKLTFDSPEQLFNLGLSQEGKIPLLGAEFYSMIDQCLDLSSYKTPLRPSLCIKDSGGYTKEQIREIVSKNLELHIQSIEVQNRKNIVMALILSVLGCFLLVVSYMVKRTFAWQMIFDFITILGWVIVWEAGTYFFLDRGLNRVKARKYRYILNGGIEVYIRAC